MEPLLRKNLSRHARVVGAIYRLAELRAYASPPGASDYLVDGDLYTSDGPLVVEDGPNVRIIV